MAVNSDVHIYVDSYLGEGDETVRLAVVPFVVVLYPDFQREKKRHHESMAADLDRTAYIFPTVLLFEGRYLGVDGQQRIEGLKLRGETEGVVHLVENVASYKRAAEIYVRMNRDRKNLDSYEKFVGSHAAHDPGTLTIHTILQEFDWHAAKSAAGADHIPAGAAITIHKRYGDEILRRTCSISRRAWGEENARESREARTLLGLSAFLKNYFEEIDDATLVVALRKVHPSSVLSKVQGDTMPGNYNARYIAYMKTLYNKTAVGRKVRRLR